LTIPIVPVESGALPYEGNELDMTNLQSGDVKRLSSDPKTEKQVFRYPYPGTWYLLPQVTKPPFGQRQGPARDRARDRFARTW